MLHTKHYQNSPRFHKVIKKQEILLECHQSNVLFARIIFFCILRAFSFLSALLETRRLIETRLILY